MTTTFHIAWKELRSYFGSWMAYVVCAGWLLMGGLIFASLLSALSLGAGGNNFSLSPLYQTLITILLFVTPLVTMRLLAEERASGSLELLFTSPLSEWQVTLGKWLGALGFCAILMILTLHYPFFALRYGSLDSGPIWGAYIALVCLAAAFCAFGVLCSSLTDSQVVAGFLTFGGLLGSWMLAWPAQAAPDSAWAQTLSQLSLFTHFSNLMSGSIDTTDLIFFASMTGFFLFATVRVLESRKWR